MIRAPIYLFGFATLAPIALIALGAGYGGAFAILAVAFLTALTALLDALVARVTPALGGDDFPTARALNIGLALGHFGLLIAVVAALSGTSLAGWEKACVFAAAGLFFGQVSNSNAHELIHRTGRLEHRLGMWVYISLLFGHHTSAHVLVHHTRVATRDDPSTARLGEGFYRYVFRAWRGAFYAGLAAETARLKRSGRALWRHPYLIYFAGAGAMFVLAWVIGGIRGMGWYLAVAAFAQTQLLMSDYVQHYGLTRATGPQGKPVPVAAVHSWNSPHWFSSALMLNAPRHSDHHANPARPYPALTLPETAPTLPRSLPIMAFVALYPWWWRRVMDPRAKALSQP